MTSKQFHRLKYLYAYFICLKMKNVKYINLLLILSSKFNKFKCYEMIMLIILIIRIVIILFDLKKKKSWRGRRLNYISSYGLKWWKENVMETSCSDKMLRLSQVLDIRSVKIVIIIDISLLKNNGSSVWNCKFPTSIIIY